MTTSGVLGPSRTALVTGASRGIGPVIARRLAAEGNHMILTGRSDSDLRTVADELRAAGGTASVLTADLTSTDAAAALVDAVERKHGGIDLLVNNAGGDPLREFHTMTVAENLQILELNLIAPLALTRAALPGMLERQRGHIVNISAMAGRVSFPFTEAYAAAKDGLIGFTRVLRSDYRARGVSASVLILGAIRDAGQGQRMLDEAGLRSSRFMAPANAVAEAAVRAVRKDHAEVVVMPGPGRLVRALMDYFPGLGPAMNDRLGSRRSLEQVIERRASHHDEGGERDIVDSSATAPAGDSDRCAS